MAELIRRGERERRLRQPSRERATPSRRGDVPGKTRVPRLVSDARRTLLAGLVSLFPASVFDDFLDRVNFGFDPVMSDVAWLICSVLIGWLFFGATYAVLTFLVFSRADGETLAHWLQASTPRTLFARFLNISSGGSSTIWTTHGSLVAVLAALSLSLLPELRASSLVMFSAMVAVAGSWLLNAVSFAIHYARKDANTRGLVFPGEDAPRFGDYFYLSVQIATGYSSSDVTTTTRAMRRAITGQCMLAFAFNTVIIAVLVSMLISAAR